ncbi:proteobacterial dedicated sortase system histidine kinase [Exilibacterium tricleocarpae]|uniref:histidine kinase n=1 Tax=Exilibacterium tricleocarpae TaxID=2591008 RepID=A0A545T1P7_9GAMM|nr:ATP-binding protein [Exilibacterium tricleocarpae]TQV71138.1 proteobacterial dedicated sortase system histidine kinase [Exilibacterium tricleocarpae]
MRLRRQLILVSLLTLSLPWAGCQYIREMEGALRQGQSVALLATATAVAAHIANDTGLTGTLREATPAAATPVYLHPLPGAAIVDGYDDDWRHQPIAEQTLTAANGFSARYRAGVFNGGVYLFLQVSDPRLTYHNPGRARLASGDHLQLHLGPDRVYVLRTSAPGRLTGRYLNASGHVRQEHRVRGAWREKIGGYQAELHFPLALADGVLGLTIVDQDEGEQPRQLSNFADRSTPPRLVRRRTDLTETVSVFAAGGLRLAVTTGDAWLVAQSGELEQPAADAAADRQHGFATWLYRLALGRTDLPELDDPARSGQFVTAEVKQALAGQPQALWYQDEHRRVGRAAVPIVDGAGGTLGSVVAEQSTDNMLALTNTAFNRLLLYSLIATGVAGLGLLAYASWLSFRIRRLSRAADTAIGEDGKIRGTFPDSNAGDEVGDLTRSYGQLLGRLAEYTDYLKSLSSKLSHELRTPLAVVRTSLDNLEHESLPAPAETFAGRAREGAGRLSAILTAMSAASRVEQSIESSELETFDLKQLLEAVVSAYADVYPRQRFTWHASPDSADFSLRGAPELLVQMLDKLVDNAADFCPPQGVISFTLEHRRGQLRLAVDNDGPPLPDQMQGQLFDSLVSIREPAAHKEGEQPAHLGLGLHIVRLIVDFHRGQVGAYNRPGGGGVVFEIHLPAAADN